MAAQISDRLMRASWSALALQSGAKRDTGAAYERVKQAYSEPPRAYHNLNHISYCLGEFQLARKLPEHPNEVEMAIWMHDSVYDPKASDNEERSANLALEICRQLGLPNEFARRVSDLILETKHKEAPQGIDSQVLTDIDLSILGSPISSFEDYEKAIKEEYSWVPEGVFRTKRAELLKGFLQRPQIYSTPHFRGRYEASARKNLERSLVRLGAK